MHIEAAIVEADTDEVDPIGTETTRQPCHPSPLLRVYPIDGISLLMGRPHLDHNTPCAIPGDEIDLSTPCGDVLCDNLETVLMEKPSSNLLTTSPGVATWVSYSEISACSSCSTLTSRKVST